MIAEREKFFEKSKKKKEEEYKLKMDQYEAKMKELNEQYYRTEQMKRNLLARVRVPLRRGSDGMIGVTFPVEKFHDKIDKLIEKKKHLKEEY